MGDRVGFRERAAASYERRGLTKGTRLLVYVSVLTHLGQTDDLRETFDWALERRVSLREIREAILETFLFAGYPRAIHAFETLAEVIEARGCDEPPPRDRLPPRSGLRVFFRRRGRDLFHEVYRGDAQAVLDRISSFHPEFSDWIVEDAYGKVLARPFLDLKTRELIAVALLTALDLPRQLTPHIRGALRAGAKPKEVAETVGQLEILLGGSRVKMALTRLSRAKTTL
jgi:4-carboxymuconolactone decarboxylase